MSSRLINVDRQTPMFFPPDLRDWVDRRDPVHFLIDALPLLDLSSAVLNQRGTGDAQYPPGLMALLLVYCYAHGIFSSRKIERATYQHVAVRYLTGNLHPDHDTVAKFRRENGVLIKSLFVQILRLAQASELVKLGVIAIDGTKLKGAAAQQHTYTQAELEEQLRQLDLQISDLLQQAEQADQGAAGEDPDDLPEALGEVRARREKLAAAQALLAAQAQERARQREAERARSTMPERGKPKPRKAEVAPEDRINLSDPETALVPGKEHGFLQGFNVQLAVSAPGAGELSLITAAQVCAAASDIQQLEPMVDEVAANLPGVAAKILVDKGYDSTRQILEVEKRHGVEVLCPPVEIAQKKEGTKRRYRWDQQRHQAREQMRARMADPVQQGLFRRRGISVEPAFGIVKHAMGFQRFRLRGLAKAQTEWTLVSLAFNCRRLAKAGVRFA
jgi:transposase